MKPRSITFALLISSCSIATAALSVFAAGWQGAKPASPQSLAFFESKVRPLLLTSCVSCHGKDKAGGGLRLDVAVNPEKAAEIVRRIKGEGGKPRMPLGAELGADKIAAIEQWVKDGAAWPSGAAVSPASDLMKKGRTHWAFQQIRRPAAPKLKSPWILNPIDAFVLNKLQTAGLQPNPPASKRELIRRVTYDLTGLPPAPEEVAAFEADKSPNAYEKVVDRLLASPHYGEKWARHWLDVVRYAETNSYERDNPKPYVFKYRDYVIRALNEDKPYDQFVREQLAGDEMPDAPGDAVLATGYYRLGIWDDEPADKLQAEYDDMDDIVATTGQAFLGLTLDCARCHDHKLDPIPQADYYRFLAIFHNINRFRNGGSTDEARYFATMETKRDHEKRTAELESKRKESLAQIAEFEKQLIAKGAVNPDDVSETNYRYYERDWKRIPEFENEPVIASGNLKPAFISIKPRQRNEEFAFEFDSKLNVTKEGDYTFKFLAEGGYQFSVDGQLFKEFASAPDAKPVEKTAKKHLGVGKHGINLIFNQRQRQHGLAISWSGPGFGFRPLSALDSVPEGGLSTLFGPELEKALSKADADRLTGVVDSLAQLEKQAPPVEKVLCVTEAGTKVPDTFILKRGVPANKGDQVQPGYPICAGGGSPVNVVPPPGNKSTGLRTRLANWMVSTQNPLVARVIVNRIWQHHFGRGIVRTPNDFGLSGIKPTHPELLDWLAAAFAARPNPSQLSTLNSQLAMGWSIKKLHKLILMSNTYRQSSRGNQVAMQKDPINDLFWRFDMRRLTAEEIRDSLLAVAGNLNPKMYGPSVYPEIAKAILAAQSRPGKDWYSERMTPEDVTRRSIYVSIKRSLIYPMFASFDLPETDRPGGIRFASTQPTQALGLLNGKLANQQAAILAARVQKEAGTEPRTFTRRLFSLVLQRPPTESEIKEGIALLSRLQTHGTKPETAQSYLALMALNLDEFLYVD